jgi:hypothetical protein
MCLVPCSVRVPFVFRACSVRVPCVFRACSVRVPCVFRACSVRVPRLKPWAIFKIGFLQIDHCQRFQPLRCNVYHDLDHVSNIPFPKVETLGYIQKLDSLKLIIANGFNRWDAIYHDLDYVSNIRISQG